MNKHNIFWNSETAIVHIVNILHKNKLIIGSTDTVLGLFAPANQQGYNALNKIKGRQNKPYLLLTSSIIEIMRYVKLDHLFRIETITKALWPGPLTIIFKARNDTPDYLCSPERNIAFRIPEHIGIQSLLQHIPLIFSTSANRSKMPTAHTIDKLDPLLIQAIEAIITDHEHYNSALPSTLIDCSTIERDIITLVREGAIPREKIEQVLPTQVQLIKQPYLT